MENSVTVEGKRHLLTYAVGVLVGLGIEYTIDKGCHLFTITKERQRERKLMIDQEKGDLVAEGTLDNGAVVFSGRDTNPNDCKLTVNVRGIYA